MCSMVKFAPRPASFVGASLRSAALAPVVYLALAISVTPACRSTGEEEQRHSRSEVRDVANYVTHEGVTAAQLDDIKRIVKSIDTIAAYPPLGHPTVETMQVHLETHNPNYDEIGGVLTIGLRAVMEVKLPDGTRSTARVSVEDSKYAIAHEYGHALYDFNVRELCSKISCGLAEYAANLKKALTDLERREDEITTLAGTLSRDEARARGPELMAEIRKNSAEQGEIKNRLVSARFYPRCYEEYIADVVAVLWGGDLNGITKTLTPSEGPGEGTRLRDLRSFDPAKAGSVRADTFNNSKEHYLLAPARFFLGEHYLGDPSSWKDNSDFKGRVLRNVLISSLVSLNHVDKEWEDILADLTAPASVPGENKKFIKSLRCTFEHPDQEDWKKISSDCAKALESGQ